MEPREVPRHAKNIARGGRKERGGGLRPHFYTAPPTRRGVPPPLHPSSPPPPPPPPRTIVGDAVGVEGGPHAAEVEAPRKAVLKHVHR